MNWSLASARNALLYSFLFIFAKIWSNCLSFWTRSAFGSDLSSGNTCQQLNSHVCCWEWAPRMLELREPGWGMPALAHLGVGVACKHCYLPLCWGGQLRVSVLHQMTLWSWIFVIFFCRGTGGSVSKEEMSTGKIKPRWVKAVLILGLGCSVQGNLYILCLVGCRTTFVVLTSFWQEA